MQVLTLPCFPVTPPHIVTCVPLAHRSPSLHRDTHGLVTMGGQPEGLTRRRLAPAYLGRDWAVEKSLTVWWWRGGARLDGVMIISCHVSGALALFDLTQPSHAKSLTAILRRKPGTRGFTGNKRPRNADEREKRELVPKYLTSYLGTCCDADNCGLRWIWISRISRPGWLVSQPAGKKRKKTRG